MIDINQVVREVSKNLNIDVQTVDTVCKHIFLYTIAVMKSPDDTKDILFNRLFKFKLKRRFKENKLKQYSAK